MKLPLDLRDIVSSGAKLREEREKPVRVAVFIDLDAPEALVDAAREALRPETGGARLHVEVIEPGTVLVPDSLADVVVAIIGPGAGAAQSLAAAREALTPTVVLSLGADADETARRVAHPIADTIVEAEPADVLHKLGGWLVDRLAGKRLALAANFRFMRKAVGEESVKNTAFQNGVIGVVAIVPGADMPIMTANQAKMLLQIAAAYGEPLGAERIKELTAVVGGAFVMRAVARQLLTFVPGFGWAIKGGIGYTGTLGMGYAAIEYFETGGDSRGFAARMADVKAKMAREQRGEPIPANAVVVESTDAAPSAPVALPSAENPIPTSGE